jgi:hypothetical protein
VELARTWMSGCVEITMTRLVVLPIPTSPQPTGLQYHSTEYRGASARKPAKELVSEQEFRDVMKSHSLIHHVLSQALHSRSLDRHLQ